MKKLTRKNLDELAGIMPKINEVLQQSFIGGGTGTRDDPYTKSEFDVMCDSGNWLGGYVEEMGYVAMEINVTPGGSNTPKNGTFVTAADLLAESNANAQNGFWGSLVESITGILCGTDDFLDLCNTFGADVNLAEYYQQNPNEQLYATDEVYLGNAGIETHQTSYYDKYGRLIAIRTYRE